MAAILDELDHAPTRPPGALLRREGLYSSHLVDWRRSARRAASKPWDEPGGPDRRTRCREVISNGRDRTAVRD